jgi:hypothetical protein
MEYTPSPPVLDQPSDTGGVPPLPIEPALPPIDATVDPARAVGYVLGVFGPTTVVAIHCDTGRTVSIWLDWDTAGNVTRWIGECNQAGYNIYITVNQPSLGLKKKAKKSNIEFIRAVWADIDCYKNGLTMVSGWAAITAMPAKPTRTIASGGGYHPYYILREPLLATPDIVARVEALGLRIAATVGGDAVQNVDRIMRFPFTLNHPDAKKRAAGRTVCPSGTVGGDEGPRYTLEELETAFSTARVVALPRETRQKNTSLVDNLSGSAPPAIMAQRRAVQSGAAGAPSMNDAAQTDVHWAGKLSPENLNAMLWAFATDPRVVALANQPRDKWRQFVWSFKAFEQLGATEAKEAARKWSQDGASEEHPFTEEGFENVWGSFDPAGGTTAGTLLGAANKVGFDLSPWRDLANGGADGTVVGSLAGTTAGGKPLKIDPSGPRAITDIPAFLQPYDAVAIMNATFAFAHNWGGEALLVQFRPDGSLTAISEEQLKKSLANRRVEITSDDGTKKSYINLAKYWLMNSQRREVDLVAFSPEGKRITAHVHSINLWRGFAKQPQKGRWRRMRKHIYKVVCRCDKKKFKYLIRWMAHAVQHPETAPGSVPVLRSASEGAGKTMVIQWMADIFGEHAIMLNDAEQLIGTFTDHLENKSFVGVNEPGFPGDHKAAGKLKSMITDSEWMINGKYRAIHRVPNIAHFMFSTNRDWAIPAGNKARRWLMLDVDERHADDEAYFAPIRRETENGGIEAMLYDLLRVDLSRFNSWNVPKTAALREQQLLSASTITRWAVDTVNVGITTSGAHGAVTLSWGWLDRRTLYEAYCLWCKNMRERALSANKFTRWLNKLGFPTKTVNGYPQYDIATPRSFGAAALHEGGIV